MTLSKEINVIIIGSMLTLGALCTIISIYSMNHTIKEEVRSVRKMLLDERMTKLKDLVANAYSVLETANFYESSQKALRQMRFGDQQRNYFLVFDTDGLIWVNPKYPETVGKVSLDMTDAHGKYYILKMIEIAKRDKDGFIKYFEKKDDSDKIMTKLTYFKLFERWNWILCTGIYIDDIEDLVYERQTYISSTIKSHTQMISVLILITLILSILLSTLMISKRIVNPLVLITRSAERIGQGIFENKIDVKSSREVVQLASSITKMQNSLSIAIERLNKKRGWDLPKKPKKNQLKKKSLKSSEYYSMDDR